jgi:hypothetical protein
MNLHKRSVVTFSTCSPLVHVHLYHAKEATHTWPFLCECAEQSCKHSLQVLVRNILIFK